MAPFEPISTIGPMQGLLSLANGEMSRQESSGSLHAMELPPYQPYQQVPYHQQAPPTPVRHAYHMSRPGLPGNAPLLSKKSKKPEFLVKLYRMLQCEDPSVINWDNGRIHVHDPKALGQEILHKYFRHSKYSSFQRQLNYFGFRKTQGKGKMSACTYTNFDLANASLKSLLKIKRKTNTSCRNGLDDYYDSKDTMSESSLEGSASPEREVVVEDRLIFLYQLAAAAEEEEEEYNEEEAEVEDVDADAEDEENQHQHELVNYNKAEPPVAPLCYHHDQQHQQVQMQQQQQQYHHQGGLPHHQPLQQHNHQGGHWEASSPSAGPMEMKAY